MNFNYDPPWYPIFGGPENSKNLDPPRFAYMGLSRTLIFTDMGFKKPLVLFEQEIIDDIEPTKETVYDSP